MRKAVVGLLGLTLASGVGLVQGPAAVAAPDRTGDTTEYRDELPNPLEDKRRELREQALKDVLAGRAQPKKRGPSTVVKVGETPTARPTSKGRSAQTRRKRDQYVELAREKTDRIFVVLAEFGNTRHRDYPDDDTDPDTPGPAVFDGPLHNAVPEPDRSADNATFWRPDFSRAYFERVYFGTGRGDESLRQYYERQSSGRYSVDGTVTDWVKVRYNEARYGRSNGFPCDSNVCSNTWFLIEDAVDRWVADQQAAGRTPAQIAAELATFDQWDRYDHDGDGNFNERDGYVDHFQIVHAGGDQADGDPHQGEDAIWSHRWYAFFDGIGDTGPPGNLLGGAQIGSTGLWVGDYTIQPENGGRSVFYHEYGHDLGLPDLYDTAGGQDPVAWWSVMAQGRLGAKGEPYIGNRAGDLGPWEKLQLGWLDYEVVVAGHRRTLDLGPHEYNSTRPQGVVVVLPKKEVTTDLGPPYAGSSMWWSGSGNNLDHTLSRRVTLPSGSAQLSFRARWDIEDCGGDPCDYAYVEVDTGTGWRAIPGSITTAAEGHRIDGVSADWRLATFDLSAYQGKTIGLRFRYTTDGALVRPGLFVDEIAITAAGTTVFSDGAETLDPSWTVTGFRRTTGTEVNAYDNYYIASNRSYVSYDRYLRTGPYNFGFLDTRPDWVEHFPYQQGLLIWYWDTSHEDNNTSEHPGEGLILPIDSRVRPIYRLDGLPWRARIQNYDAPFTHRRADSFPLHDNSRPSFLSGQRGVPVFDDTGDWLDPLVPGHGVKVPHAGVSIAVLEERGTSMRIRISPTSPAP